VNPSGNVSLGDRIVSVGLPLAGQRVTLRLEGPVAHVLAGGVLVRTLACPVPPEGRPRLRGEPGPGPLSRPACPVPGHHPARLGARVGHGRRAEIQVGLAHVRKTVEVTVEADTYQITVEPESSSPLSVRLAVISGGIKPPVTTEAGPMSRSASRAGSSARALMEHGEGLADPFRFLGHVFGAVSGIFRRECELDPLVPQRRARVGAQRVPEQAVLVDLR